jgi:hypothetical protein
MSTRWKTQVQFRDLLNADTLSFLVAVCRILAMLHPLLSSIQPGYTGPAL